MKGVRKFYGGEATSVATIRKRRRAVSDSDALHIRDMKMLECRIRDELDDDAIAAVFGLSRRSVQAGISRATQAIRDARQAG